MRSRWAPRWQSGGAAGRLIAQSRQLAQGEDAGGRAGRVCAALGLAGGSQPMVPQRGDGSPLPASVTLCCDPNAFCVDWHRAR